MIITQKISRVASIDVFRAITMLLMIFVNDLWTLRDIPSWLEHVSAAEDGLGLADVVFPAFLFIVGLSIPLAVQYRFSKGDSDATIIKHTLWRGLALIIMGVFHVNLESYSDSAILPKELWEIIITVSFFFIWLDYPKDMAEKKKYFLKGLGVVLLVVMASLYKGGSANQPQWMTTQWWGILGLIGWSYLIGSLIYIFFRNNILVQIAFFVFFISFSAAAHLQALAWLSFIRPYVWLISEGALPAIVMAGIIVTGLYLRTREESNYPRFFILMTASSVLLILFCVVTRPWWGIHKISASPSWVALCIAISILFFIILIRWVDIKQKDGWFSFLKPAGTSTLTCYLLPYLHYSIISWIGISLPMFLRTGMIGILKSILYALAIVALTGILEKKKIKLKL